MTGELAVSRGTDRKAAIAASQEEFGQEQVINEAEEAAYAEDALRTLEHDTRLEQEEILRRYPTHGFSTLEEWQEALQGDGFYYTDLEGYQKVLRNPTRYLGSYEDMGDPWVVHNGTVVVPGVGVFVSGHLVESDDVSDITGRYGDGPDETHPVFTSAQLDRELFG